MGRKRFDGKSVVKSYRSDDKKRIRDAIEKSYSAVPDLFGDIDKLSFRRVKAYTLAPARGRDGGCWGGYNRLIFEDYEIVNTYFNDSKLARPCILDFGMIPEREFYFVLHPNSYFDGTDVNIVQCHILREKGFGHNRLAEEGKLLDFTKNKDILMLEYLRILSKAINDSARVESQEPIVGYSKGRSIILKNQKYPDQHINLSIDYLVLPNVRVLW
jgi:hypothetical protein